MSFYDWLVEEGYRPNNPVRQTRRPRRRPSEVRRLSGEEVTRLLGTCNSERERRAIYLLLFAGLRSAELRGLRGRHLERDDWIWVSSDIAKGSKERWIPVTEDLAPIVERLRRRLEPDDYVLPAQRWRDPGFNSAKVDKRKHPSSAQALQRLVARVGARAGIPGRVYPHLLRHAFAEQITRHTGLREAQALMGHADSRTTEIYLGRMTADELRAAIKGFTFGLRTAYPPLNPLANPLEAPTGVEPV